MNKLDTFIITFAIVGLGGSGLILLIDIIRTFF